MNKFKKSSLFYYLICFLSISSCSVEQVMSKAGVMTHPRCAKYSTEEAVATCEAGLRGRSEPRFSVGFGFSKRMEFFATRIRGIIFGFEQPTTHDLFLKQGGNE